MTKLRDCATRTLFRHERTFLTSDATWRMWASGCLCVVFCNDHMLKSRWTLLSTMSNVAQKQTCRSKSVFFSQTPEMRGDRLAGRDMWRVVSFLPEVAHPEIESGSLIWLFSHVFKARVRCLCGLSFLVERNKTFFAPVTMRVSRCVGGGA